MQRSDYPDLIDVHELRAWAAAYRRRLRADRVCRRLGLAAAVRRPIPVYQPMEVILP